MIANSGHDENGRYSGGAAGDQTGSEWEIRAWYNRPWNCVLRYPDIAVGEMIAELAREAAANDAIGYDQGQRRSFYTALSQSGWRPANITTKCEADCSAGVAALVIATGHLLGLPKLQAVSPDCYTGNLKAALKAAGFDAFTDKSYLISEAYLQPGDVLLYEGHHTAIELDWGSKAERPTEPEPFYKNLGWNQNDNGWWYAWGSEKGQYHCNNVVRIADADGTERLWAFDVEGYLVDPNSCEMNANGSIKYIHGTRIKP